jgi:hypothetical protein
MDEPKFEEWALVEVMGRQRFAGRVREAVVAGHGFLRVDVPAIDDEPPFTKLFGPCSVFSIMVCTEAVALAAARAWRSVPMDRYELRQLVAPATTRGNGDDDDGDDGRYDDAQGRY